MACNMHYGQRKNINEHVKVTNVAKLNFSSSGMGFLVQSKREVVMGTLAATEIFCVCYACQTNRS